MSKFDRYAFSAAVGYDESATRKAFSRAVPLRTLVIYRYDPRAADIPSAVAKRLDELVPGNIVLDAAGNRAASSPRSSRSSWRADARSMLCGPSPSPSTSSVLKTSLSCTTRTAEQRHLRRRASSMPGSGSIMLTSRPFTIRAVSESKTMSSLKHDTALIRSHPGTPRHVKIVGYFFNIDSGELVEVVSDPADAESARERHTSPYEARPRMVAS